MRRCSWRGGEVGPSPGSVRFVILGPAGVGRTVPTVVRRPSTLVRVALALGALWALMSAGCLGSQDPPLSVTIDGGTPAPTDGAVVVRSTASAPAAVPFIPPSPVSDLDPEDLHGFVMPLEGACLPSNERLMPNAPREYRNGVHEGVDFYFGDACVVVERGTPVRAAYGGVVVRADHQYVDPTLEEVAALEARTAEQGASDAETLDVFRGRQVWIDHGNGVVTRYSHLNAIAPELAEGIRVPGGHVVGAVGESGTPESITAPGTELHLHWEVRVGDSFLGEGLEASEVRALYDRLFEAPAAP